MTSIYSLLNIIIFFACTQIVEGQSSNDFRDITQMITAQEFEAIKSFILNNGDRRTYCNKYNNNPHYSFEGFDVYLNPETEQANINCDSDISDFNDMVIHDRDSDPQYYHLLIVRPGDLANTQVIRATQEMQEGRVYLLNFYDDKLDLMMGKLDGYISKIKEGIE